MDTSKINASKIKAAGNNFSIIGYTMIAVIVITLIQVFYAANADMRSRGDLESIKAANVVFMLLYIVCTIIIIGNLISAGSKLSSCDDEVDNTNIDSEILVSKLNMTSSRTGELSEGGIIVNTNENDEHGLVCSNDDLGKVNWDDAKKLCEGYREGGFSDWRLPNKDELQLIYFLLHKKKGIGGFAWKGKTSYWCSTDSNKYDALEVHFEYGNIGTVRKSLSNHVRAVRSF